MKNLIFNFLKIFLLINIIIFSLGCPDVFTDDIGSISGIVTDINKNPIANVKVTIRGKEIYSDDKGLFSIEKVPVGKDQVVEFSKLNHVSNQKQATIELNKNTLVFASLGVWDKTETINPSQENTISFQNAEVKLPANGIVDANGSAFTGNVTVKAAYFDPMSDNYGDVFPGDFEGEDMSGNIVPIESYGFINIELSDGNQSLNLAKGSSADITIPIPDALKANAPNPIPLWFFDEEFGIWKEDGEASIQNGVYVGKVSHFTAWNADYLYEVSSIKGRVVCKDGSPLPNARVKARGVNYSGTTYERSDANGYYEIDVKANAKVDINAFRLTGIGTILNTSQTIHVNTLNTNETKTIEDLIIDCDTSKSYSRLYDVVLGSFYMAVGESGLVLIKDLSSDLWTRLDAATTQDFYSIDSPSKNRFWIVGSNGTIKYSSDYGQNWSNSLIGTDAHLYDIEFYDGYRGWIVGTTGKIFKTTNGGDNWTNQVSGTVETLYDCSFVSNDKGWICGSKGTILHTENGGNTWHNQTSTTIENLKGIKFTNDQNGWAVGDNGKIIRTVNGGQTWFDQSYSGILEDLNGIDFAHFAGGAIVGNNGIVLKTEDGGENWTNESVALKNNIEAVNFSSQGWGYIVGDDNSFQFNIGYFNSVSKGWNLQNSGVSDTLRDVKTLSTSEAWIVGDNGTVLHTSDSGTGWNSISTGNLQNFYSIEVMGSNIWVGGDNRTLMKSTDSGSSWQTIQNIQGGKTIIKITFINNDYGWCILEDQGVPNNNEILQTSDGGLNWTTYANLPGGIENYYYDFFFIDKNNGMILNYDETNDALCSYETIDGGLNWQSKFFSSGTDEEACVFIFDNSIYWIAGDFSMLRYESGKNWYSNFEPTFYKPRDMIFTNNQTGWIISGNIPSYLIKTIDGGKNWVYQGSASETYRIYGFQGIDMVNNNVGWAVGDKGKIYYTTTGGD